jgi:hypothetical protein
MCHSTFEIIGMLKELGNKCSIFDSYMRLKELGLKCPPPSMPMKERDYFNIPLGKRMREFLEFTDIGEEVYMPFIRGYWPKLIEGGDWV